MRCKIYAVLAVLVFTTLAGCTLRGFQPPADPWEEFTRQDRSVTLDEVKKALEACGGVKEYGYLVRPSSNPDNERAMLVECMFTKGYVFKSGWGGMCSVPEYRTTLPACQNAPVRPRYR